MIDQEMTKGEREQLARFLALPPDERERKGKAMYRQLITRTHNQLLFARAAAAQPDATVLDARRVTQFEQVLQALTGGDPD